MKSRVKILAAVLVLSIVSSAAPTIARDGDAQEPTGKLMVVWTSADPDVADKVCLMYTHAAKKYGWFSEVRLVVWGPSQRLLAGDPSLQAKVRSMQADGVIVEACIACATKLDLVETIREMGIEVRGMGVPLTEALKDPETEVITF